MWMGIRNPRSDQAGGKRREAAGDGGRFGIDSGMNRRCAVDASTQHVKTADASRLLAQLERQQGGAGGHMGRLERLRSCCPLLLHHKTITEHEKVPVRSTEHGRAGVYPVAGAAQVGRPLLLGELATGEPTGGGELVLRVQIPERHEPIFESLRFQ